MTNFNIVDIQIDNKVIKGAYGYGPNYTFTGESKIVDNTKVYQIIALDCVYSAEAGQLGGWVEDNELLSQEDRCWIDTDVVLMGETLISGDCLISGNVKIRDSYITDSSINECEEDATLTISNSTINNTELTAEGLIKNTNIIKCNMVMNMKKMPEIILDSCKLLNIALLTSGSVELYNCEFEDLELEIIDSLKYMKLKGEKLSTRRTGIYYDSGNIPEELQNKEYLGYLPFKEFELDELIEVLKRASTIPYDNNSIEGKNTIVRSDIESFLNSFK